MSNDVGIVWWSCRLALVTLGDLLFWYMEIAWYSAFWLFWMTFEIKNGMKRALLRLERMKFAWHETAPKSCWTLWILAESLFLIAICYETDSVIKWIKKQWPMMLPHCGNNYFGSTLCSRRCVSYFKLWLFDRPSNDIHDWNLHYSFYWSKFWLVGFESTLYIRLLRYLILV